MKNVLLTIFIACSASYSQSTFDFPFESGSVWEFQFSSSDVGGPSGVERIYLGIDTLLPNNHFYKPYYSQDGVLFYLRKDSTKVYQYWPTNSSEFLKYDFSRSKGDTISYLTIFSNSTPVLVIADTVVSIFGVNRRMVTTKSAGAFIADNVVDSIGLFSWWHGIDPSYQLMGAMISGRKYGTISSTQQFDTPVPRQSRLIQNYPNPFNPNTTIEYELAKTSPIRISISNQLGQRVAILVNGINSAGSHRITWNSSRVPSGIYYCTLEIGSERITRKLVVLK